MANLTKKPDVIPEFVATMAQYRQALLSIRPHLTDRMLALLRLQYRAPNHTISSIEIADHFKLDTHSSANRLYALFAKLMATALEFTPPCRGKTTISYWCTLSTGDTETSRTEEGRFVMRPEFAEAVADLRWA